MSDDSVNQLIHDVRNPLNNISMHAELAKMLVAEGATEEKILQTLDNILQHCQHCSTVLSAFKENS